ncbi:hypothetical protein EH32_05150 [Erythrobacter litoralis]|uniref:Uncharacterized protein n=2 Tax=Erythrobacter litoralis TaxID=39960 RepID=A0A074MU04_9SPHN|nr:hypothetical protein EH32_05150 [Erythrobacter litoralis]
MNHCRSASTRLRLDDRDEIDGAVEHGRGEPGDLAEDGDIADAAKRELAEIIEASLFVHSAPMPGFS